MAFNNKSRQKCIDTNDFESAKENFEHTNKRWSSYWWEAIEQIFNSCKEWSKKYILDPINRVINKASTAKIVWNCEDKNWEKGTELFYLIRAFDSNNTRVFSKVGTTTQKVEARMKQHLRAYKNLDIQRIEIDRVYQCDTVAEGFESWFRALYIRKFTNAFKKNDRFFGVDFDLKEADKMYNDYVGLAV